MITKTKTSVSLSHTLLEELAQFNKGETVSEFVEKALAYYINELKRRERGQRDIAIIQANAERFCQEAEENLAFQAMP
jgi:metal-responsive CopG/Arc/MetJ family transcriptional regulator